MFNRGKCCQRQCGLCSVFRLGHAGASAQVATVVGVSRFVLERVATQGYFSHARRHVVHNCTPANRRDSNLKQRSNHPLRFGYIGTLSENKGVGWLIEQFQRLDIDARLDIAGRGKLEYEAKLKAMADPTKVSFRLLRQRRLHAEHRCAGGAVAVGRAVRPVAVEGCANNLPVIASNMGGLPEIIRDEYNGLLCSPDDPDSLGIAMLWLYIDGGLRQRLAGQARASVLSLLDMERMLDQYQSILHETLQEREFTMNQSLLITPRRRDSNPLAFDKPTLLTLVVASLLLTETFRCPALLLRHGRDFPLLYLPKVACLAALSSELLRYRGWPLFWLVMLGLVTSSQLALMHGAELHNIGFSLFIYIPLLFGLICGRHLELRLGLLRRVIGFCLIASFVGIALDLTTSVPWKGYSYMVGEVELSANRSGHSTTSTASAASPACPPRCR